MPGSKKEVRPNRKNRNSLGYSTTGDKTESEREEAFRNEDARPRPRSEHCPTSLIGFLSVHHGIVGIKVGLRRAEIGRAHV